MPSTAGSDAAGPAPSYRFARSPAWIASHLFVLLCVVLFVRLGIWQLARMGERAEANDRIAARVAEAPVPLDELLAPDASPDDVDAVERRPVEVRGTYDTADEVLVANRSSNETPGYWVVTPLDTGTGVVAVNRGWVPLVTGEEDPGATAPPPGEVAVTGYLRASEDPVPEVGTAGSLARPRLPRLDTARLAELWGVGVHTAYVQLTEQDPAQPGPLPEPVPAPELDAGPHLSYAIQWFTFAGLTVVVYALILRRVARERGGATSRPGAVGSDSDVAPAGGAVPPDVAVGER